MRYKLYHDESKQSGFWHGIFLVPISTRQILLNYLSESRNNTGYQHPLKLTNVKKKGKIYNCAECWIQLGVVALMSRIKGEPEYVWLGRRSGRSKQYKSITDIIGCKFILFRERDDHATITGHRDYGSKVETTFRMGLKGGLHYLGNLDNSISIIKMHFDGHEHYRRHIDRERIVNRLYNLRSYCSIDENDDLINDRTSDHTRNKCQEYGDCQLLQLVDLIVGCFRVVLQRPSNTKAIHRQLASPVKAIVDRYQQGYRRMQNSRWRDSFCMSQCYLDSNGWKFDTIQYLCNDSKKQLPLVFD